MEKWCRGHRKGCHESLCGLVREVGQTLVSPVPSYWGCPSGRVYRRPGSRGELGSVGSLGIPGTTIPGRLRVFLSNVSIVISTENGSKCACTVLLVFVYLNAGEGEGCGADWNVEAEL